MSSTSSDPLDPALAPPAHFDAEERARIRGRLQILPRRRLHMPLMTPWASVLVPLCHVDGEASVLFTKRTETVSTHKGQVSFPGGRRDPEDQDDIDTALRELEEEIGVHRDAVDVLGTFHEVMSITQVCVTPVVGFIGEVGDRGGLRLSPHEIDVAFTLPLSALIDVDKRTLQQLGNRHAPLFTAGPHPVWGLTAWILDEVLREALGLALPPLLPP
jgi:nudix motif 8